MVRFAFVLILALVAIPGTAAPAVAQTCWVAPGFYVDTDPGEAVIPGLVMNVAGMPCWADVRLLAMPDRPFDPATRSFYEHQLEPLAGPPPYDKPNGCPYAAGEEVDLKDQYGAWYPGLVASASRDCGYLIDYWMGQQQKSFSAYDADLRPRTLAMPVIDPNNAPGPNGEPVIIVQACTNGAKFAELVGTDSDTSFRRAVIDAINSRQTGADFSVGFETVVEGEGTIAARGSDVASRYQNAATDAVVHRYRMTLSVCEEDKVYGGEPYVVRYRYDQSCYDDIFGEFVCAIDNVRSLS